jgi:hypothetical protein
MIRLALCRMVRIIADEFLTEERDRKYYADHYTCCPPPLFILLITLIEVSELVVTSLNRRLRSASRVLPSATRRSVFTARYVLPTQCIYVFCVDLRTNSDYLTMQH